MSKTFDILDFIKVMVIAFLFMVVYNSVTSVIEPIKCMVVSCKADLEAKIIQQDVLIKELQNTIKNNNKIHKDEVDNLKANLKELKDLKDKDKNTDDRANQHINRLKEDKKPSAKPKDKQWVAAIQNTAPPRSEPLEEILETDSIEEIAAKGENQIEVLWEMYCENPLVTCKAN